MNNSLQNKLFAWLSIAILAIGILASGISFWLAYNEAQKFQDDELHQVALLVDTYKTPLAEELFLESMERDPKRIVVQPVITPPTALPPLLKLPDNLSSGFHTLEIDGLSWRVYIYATAVSHNIAVAQEAKTRKIMARNSALLTLLPLLVLVPILILVLRQIIKAEMSSLRTLAEIIDAQNKERLSVLPTSTVPREVAPFVQAINRLLERINQMNESQRRFIANAAHELRSPLTALSLQAQNLERTGSFSITKDRLIPLKDGLERSRHLLNQMLDMVRQQASAAKPIPLYLAAVALAVIEEIMPIADAKKIDLGITREASVRIDADAAAIKMMLRNAVDNALRYSPEGGEVTIRIGQENGDAILQVIDSGPGIPEAEIERVFDAFYRLPNNTQTGSGLGLAIARSIADQF
ncbi:MAG: HAMP domain-containing histidine kinase, partial [Nitrosomonadales bacterium]|nr:HAMP domain-containing histidine kinase [Nitrosomonadales bacterium]